MSIKKVLKKNKKHLTKFLTRIIVFSYRTFETKNKKISSNGEKIALYLRQRVSHRDIDKQYPYVKKTYQRIFLKGDDSMGDNERMTLEKTFETLRAAAPKLDNENQAFIVGYCTGVIEAREKLEREKAAAQGTKETA